MNVNKNKLFQDAKRAFDIIAFDSNDEKKKKKKKTKKKKTTTKKKTFFMRVFLCTSMFPMLQRNFHNKSAPNVTN